MTENTAPYTREDVQRLMDPRITRDIARLAVAHILRVRGMDDEALEALLYDALVELDYSLIP